MLRKRRFYFWVCLGEFDPDGRLFAWVLCVARITSMGGTGTSFKEEHDWHVLINKQSYVFVRQRVEIFCDYLMLRLWLPRASVNLMYCRYFQITEGIGPMAFPLALIPWRPWLPAGWVVSVIIVCESIPCTKWNERDHSLYRLCEYTQAHHKQIIYCNYRKIFCTTLTEITPASALAQ